MISMRDIAARCGVSVATVSKALNDHGDISEQTKKFVRETAQELGYYPNASARTLKTSKSNNIGALFVDRAKQGLKQDFFAGVLDSFKVTAESKGYDLTFINCNRDAGKMTFLEHCRYRGVDGVVVAQVNFDQPEVQELIRSEIPLVTIDHTFDNKPAVVSDNIKGMKDLVEYIISQGHTKIAYINGGDADTSTVTRNRIGSYFNTLNEHGLEINDEYLLDGEYRDPEACYKATLKLLDMEEPPTCIIYCDDFASIGGINAIKERGLVIPDDISIAGYDGIAMAKYLEPKIATIEQADEEIGRVAAEKLIELIERPKTMLIDRIVIPGKLLKGNSIKNLYNTGI